MRGLIGGQVWKKTQPLRAGAQLQSASGPQSKDFDKLIQIQVRVEKGK